MGLPGGAEGGWGAPRVGVLHGAASVETGMSPKCTQHARKTDTVALHG